MPDLVWSAFATAHLDVDFWQRVLSADWVETWDGWQEARGYLSEATGIGQLRDAYLRQFVTRFLNLAINNIAFTARTDSERKDQIVQSGKAIGSGLVFNSNACLADSLLQLMFAHGFLKSEYSQGSREAIRARQSACLAARSYLVSHADSRLHPCLRDHRGDVIRANRDEHATAFLEHDRHAEACGWQVEQKKTKQRDRAM